MIKTDEQRALLGANKMVKLDRLFTCQRDNAKGWASKKAKFS
jgi:hypothetical protein